MTIIDILILFLIIVGVAGAGWLIIAGFVFLYGIIENFFLRRRIPETIKREVEDERIRQDARAENFRRKYAGTGNPETEAAFGRIRNGDIIPKSETLQQVSPEPESSDTGNTKSDIIRTVEIEGRSKPVDRYGKRRKLRRID